MIKISVTTFIMMLAIAQSEPPINSYLPPRMRAVGKNGGQADLYTRYGIPDFGNAVGINRNTETTSFSEPSNAGNVLPKLYDASVVEGNAGGNGLGVSRENGFEGGQPSNFYRLPNSDNGKPPSNYDVPDANQRKDGGFKNGGNGGILSSTYSILSMSHRKNDDKSKQISTTYGVPDANGNHGGSGSDFRNSNNVVKPLTSYGVPGANKNHHGTDDDRGSDFRNSGNGTPPSNSYSVSNANGNNFGNNKNLNADVSSGGASRGENNSEKNNINDSTGNRGLFSGYNSPNKARNGNNNGYSSSASNRYGGANKGYLSDNPSRNADYLDNSGFGHGGSFGHEGVGVVSSYNDDAQEESIESAKYEFSYEVKDEQSGSDYGHTETRNGDCAQGEFNVLLPDGRKQIVEYEADQDGFKPQIRYEANANGYGSDGSNSNNGYSFDKPGSGGSNFADNSKFNEGSRNNGYPNSGLNERKLDGFNSGSDNGYQSEKPGKQSFHRDNNNNGLNDDINRYFSNVPSNSIDDTFSKSNDNVVIGNNRQNGNNNGYQY